jgi:precorrin-6B methylase 1
MDSLPRRSGDKLRIKPEISARGLHLARLSWRWLGVGQRWLHHKADRPGMLGDFPDPGC